MSISFSTPISAFAETGCLDEKSGTNCSDNNAYDGYWWRGYWIEGLVSQASRFMPMPTLVTGSAVMYNPGLMQATAEFRKLYIPGLGYNVNGTGGFIGGVATETCSEIGTSVWLKREEHGWEGPFLVVDCAQRNDVYGQIVDWGLSVEVDFNTGMRWGMVTSNQTQTNWRVNYWRVDNVLLSKTPPGCLGELQPVKLSDWFKDLVVFATPQEERPAFYYSPSTWLVDGEMLTFENTVCFEEPLGTFRR